VATIEAQTMASNEAARAFYRKFGFTEIDQGVVFRKDQPPSLLPPLGDGQPTSA
jgi:ribosomal protein S18 acetylase RimI-like enzyme